MQQIRIPPRHRAAIELNPRQPDGEPAVIDGAPSYEVGPEGLVGLAFDGGVAKLVAADGEGVTTLTVRCDVRVGDEVSVLEEVYEVVVAEEANTFGLELGDLEPAIDT
jgi:hypothetical protein